MPGAALWAVITEIAAAEGPVLRRRIYRLVAQASGNLVPGVQPDVDRELNALLLEGRLDQIEPLGLSHPDTSVIAIESPTPIPARCLGNRAVWEISRSERDAIVARVRSAHLAADAADVARHLGLSERSWETQLVERWLS